MCKASRTKERLRKENLSGYGCLLDIDAIRKAWMAAIGVFDFTAKLAVTEAVVREAIAVRRNAVPVSIAIAIDRDRDTASVARDHLGNLAPAAL